MRGEKRIFTEEEIKYIIDNWGKESAHSMKKKFNCSWYAVCSVAEKHGLDMPKSNEWTEEDVDVLKELSEEFHYFEIAEILGRSKNSIYLKARKLGITLIQDRRKWTEEEEQQLEELWGSKSIEVIAKRLKRTVFSLKVKAVRMKLGPMIRNVTDKLTVYDIVDLIGVSRDRITTTWIKLGLKLKKKKLTKKASYYFIEWDDFVDFLEKNQNEWDSRNLDVNMLGIEYDWLVEKRKRDRDTNPLWYRFWTNQEISYAEHLFRIGKSPKEIAKKIQRTEGTVITLLRNLGYKSDVYWTDEEVEYLQQNYKNKTYAEIAEEIGRTSKAVNSKASELGFQKIIR